MKAVYRAIRRMARTSFIKTGLVFREVEFRADLQIAQRTSVASKTGQLALYTHFRVYSKCPFRTFVPIVLAVYDAATARDRQFDPESRAILGKFRGVFLFSRPNREKPYPVPQGCGFPASAVTPRNPSVLWDLGS